jgi:hypothetical protein
MNQMMGLLEGKTLLVVIPMENTPCSTWNSLSTARTDWSMAPAGLAELRGDLLLSEELVPPGRGIRDLQPEQLPARGVHDDGVAREGQHVAGGSY